jgi:hypothetical protein
MMTDKDYEKAGFKVLDVADVIASMGPYEILNPHEAQLPDGQPAERPGPFDHAEFLAMFTKEDGMSCHCDEISELQAWHDAVGEATTEVWLSRGPTPDEFRAWVCNKLDEVKALLKARADTLKERQACDD